MGIKTYDPARVYVLYGGIPISGFSPDNGIIVSRNDNVFDTVRGIGGSISRKKKLDQSGIVTLNLFQTSLSNDVLSGFALLDEKVGAGILPLAIIDITSKSTYISAFAWVESYVEANYSSNLSTRTWKLICPELQMYTGGVTDADANVATNNTIVSR